MHAYVFRVFSSLPLSVQCLDQPYPETAGLSGAAQAAVGRDSISGRIGVPEAELELPEGGRGTTVAPAAHRTMITYRLLGRCTEM